MAFGLLAVFGVIRFRNVLKDTRDTVFILWAITEGMGVGTMRYSTAIVGAVGIALVLLYLRFTSFGTRNRYDAVVTLRVVGDLVAGNTVLKRVLHRHASRRATRQPAAVDRCRARHHLPPAAAGSCPVGRTAGRTRRCRQTFENVSVFLHTDETEI